MIFTAVKYREILSTLSFAAQIPIFIAISDFGYEFFHTTDHWHSVTKLYVMEGATCVVYSDLKPFWINVQTAWTIGCAVYLYRFLLGSKMAQPTFGKNNIYLKCACWGVPILLLFIALIVLSVLYSIIIYKLFKILRENELKNTDDNAAITKANDRIKGVIRMIGIYPIAYICQWFAYALLKLGLIELTWGVLIYIVLTTNFGGCFNCLLYGPLLFNQIKRSKEKERNKMGSQMTNSVMSDEKKTMTGTGSMQMERVMSADESSIVSAEPVSQTDV